MAKSKVERKGKVNEKAIKSLLREKLMITILSIQVVSDVQVCLEHQPVKKPKEPNWSNQLPPKQWHDGMGSKRPGVYLLPDDIMAGSEDMSLTSDNNDQYSIQDDVDKLLTINETVEEVPEYEALAWDSKKIIRQQTQTFEMSTIMNIFNQWITPPAPPDDTRDEGKDKKRSLLKMEFNINPALAALASIRRSDLKSTGTPGKAMLSGLLKNFVFYGDINLHKTGKQTIYLAPLEEPRTLKRIWGDMKWYLLLFEGDTLETCFYMKDADTRMELFWIFGRPLPMYKRGVWAEALRLLDTECGGIGTVSDVIQRVVNYCHSGAGLRYDCYYFCSYYVTGNSGGAFNLGAYLHSTYLFCNCFDQAGALQTLLGALGIAVQWTYMSPFGYLNDTQLIGRGMCNNPGFLKYKMPPITPTNDEDRTPFGSHVFCILKSGEHEIVLDACAGPHFGGTVERSYVTSYKQNYLTESIDGMTSCYETSKHMKNPGRLNDMDMDNEGVLDVHAVLSNPVKDNEGYWKYRHKRLEKFIEDTDYNAAGQELSKEERKQGVFYEWVDPRDLVDLENKYWQSSFEDIRLGIDIAVKQWSFKAPNSAINIEFFVSNNLETSKQNLLVLAMAHNHPDRDFTKKAKDRHVGHLNIYSDSEYYRVEAWWFYNVCVRITAFNPPVDIDELTHGLQRLLESKLNPGIADYLPVIDQFNVFTTSNTPYPGSVAVNETVTIQIKPADNPLLNGHQFDLEFFLSQNNIRFQEQSIPSDVKYAADDKSGVPPFDKPGFPPDDKTDSTEDDVYTITFIALTPGVSTIKFLLADKDTLLTSTHREISINVVGTTE